MIKSFVRQSPTTVLVLTVTAYLGTIASYVLTHVTPARDTVTLQELLDEQHQMGVYPFGDPPSIFLE